MVYLKSALETCVGRMRYVGVVFYDMDKVEAMAATKNEQDIYISWVNLRPS